MYDADRHAGPSLQLTESQNDLVARARRIADEVCRPGAAETDRTEEYPWKVVEALTAEGLMGQTVPAELGGPGRSYFETVLVIEELAAACGVSGRIMVEGNMGAVGAVLAYGNEDQRRIAAEHVLSGDKPAICSFRSYWSDQNHG